MIPKRKIPDLGSSSLKTPLGVASCLAYVSVALVNATLIKKFSLSFVDVTFVTGTVSVVAIGTLLWLLKIEMFVSDMFIIVHFISFISRVR